MPTVSLVMIVKNEERCLARCLDSAKLLVNEMVVVDTGSTDNTIAIARTFGAKVLSYEWNDDFAAARNFGIECSTGDWILSLDADEYFEYDYRTTLSNFLMDGPHIGRVNIKSSFIRDGQEFMAQANVSRIFPRDIRYKGIIHEQLDSSLPRVDSGLSLLHDGYLDNKSGRNIPLLTRALSNDPTNAYLLFQLAREYRGLEQFSEAERYYAEACSHVSSTAGFAAETFVDYLYVLLKNRKFERALEIVFAESDRLKAVPDFHFVQAHIFMELAIADPSLASDLLPQIEQSYLECLRLGRHLAKEIVVGTASYLAEYNLAIYYELTLQIALAKIHYNNASKLGYQPARDRLSRL